MNLKLLTCIETEVVQGRYHVRHLSIMYQVQVPGMFGTAQY